MLMSKGNPDFDPDFNSLTTEKWFTQKYEKETTQEKA